MRCACCHANPRNSAECVSRRRARRRRQFIFEDARPEYDSCVYVCRTRHEARPVRPDGVTLHGVAGKSMRSRRRIRFQTRGKSDCAAPSVLTPASRGTKHAGHAYWHADKPDPRSYARHIANGTWLSLPERLSTRQSYLPVRHFPKWGYSSHRGHFPHGSVTYLLSPGRNAAGRQSAHGHAARSLRNVRQIVDCGTDLHRVSCNHSAVRPD